MNNNKPNYTVRTVSLIRSGRILEEHYVGDDRREASKIASELQRKSIPKIQLLDRHLNKTFQYEWGNEFEYKLKILPYES